MYKDRDVEDTPHKRRTVMAYQCSACPREVKMVYGPTFCMSCTSSGRHVQWWKEYEALRTLGMDAHAAQETVTANFRAMEVR